MDDQSLSPAPSLVANEDLDEPVEGCTSSLVPQEHLVEGRTHSPPLFPWSTGSRAAHSPPRSHRSTALRAAHSPPRSPRSTASMAAHSPPRSHRSTGSSPVPHEGCLLFPLLRSLEATDSTGRCDSPHVWPLLDVSAKQHADHACTQPTCGGEVRGEYNSCTLFYIRK